MKQDPTRSQMYKWFSTWQTIFNLILAHSVSKQCTDVNIAKYQY